MVEKKEKVIKGLVKAVNSGDFFLIHKSTKSGPSTEIQAYLASIQAPKMGSSNRTEEPFAFDAREFLRDKIIGKKCEFYPEYNYGGRDYGTLIVNGENLNLSLVKAGLVKVVEKKGNLSASSHYEELMAAQQEIKNRKVGVFSADEKYIQKHTRNVTYFSDAGYNIAKIFEEAKDIEKPLEGIVEYVFSASYLTVFIHKFMTVVKLSMVHLFTPQQAADKTIQNEGKVFTEKLLLHRTVGVKLERLEEGGNLYARIFHPAGDIAYEVVKNGFAKLTQPKNIDFDADYYKTLKEAQLIAQGKNLRIWKDFKQEEKKQQKPSTTDFTGRVVEIHSGDSLTVERDSDFALIRVFFTTVKAPQLMKKPGEEPDPYAWESKEALRKATIGKKVKVVMEYSRTVKAGEGERNMDFASVFLDKNEKNVATLLLEKGLLKTNVNKSGDNASKYLEDLLAAEKKAVESKIGVYSNSQAPIRMYNDIVSNPKKSKDFEAMVMKRPNRKMNGVVEYCFSGMRFKVRLDGENTAIAFNLLGVKTMANDKNQPQLLEFSNEALQFAKDTLFQKDVVVEPDFADKRGSFFGTVTLTNKKDFGLMLIQEGLAQVSIFGNKAPHNIAQLEEAEKDARAQGVGIWAKNLKIVEDSSSKKVKQNERIQVLMTDITDASSFYVRLVNDNQYAKVEAELSKFDSIHAQDMEKPIKRGTICAARFKLDDKWYRGKILKSIGKGQFEVQFIDFGNVDVVNGDDLKRLTQSLLQYEPQAKHCSLAYIRAQRAGNTMGEEAAKLVQEIALDSVTDAIVVAQQEDLLKIVLFEKGEKNWNNSINCKLVEKGLAMMDKFNEEDEDLPEEINEWYSFEEEAKEAQLKIWQYGGAGDESD